MNEDQQPVPTPRHLSKVTLLSLGGLVILGMGLASSIFLSQQNQDTRSKASVTYKTIVSHGVTSNQTPLSTTLKLTKPAGTIAGDVIVAHVVAKDGTVVVTPPAGFVPIQRVYTATTYTSSTYYKIADAAIPVDFVFTFSKSVEAAGGMASYANVDTASPIDAKSSQANVNTTSMDAPSITTTVANDLLLYFGTVGTSIGLTPPTGMIQKWAVGTPIMSVLAEAQLTSAGAVGVKTGKSAAATALTFGEVIALKPAPSTTSVTAVSPTVTKAPTTIPPTATKTPVPTVIAATATPFPTSVVTPTKAVPTNTPAPTSTPVPGTTYAGVTVLLHGIGKGGDSVNPTGQGNLKPLHAQRTVTVDIFDAQNQLVLSKQGMVTYDAAAGNYKGNVDLGTQLSTGIYSVKVKTDQYLRGLVSGIQTITKAQVNTLPSVTLVAGDINNDNQVNIVDYNIIVGCYSDLLPPISCSVNNKAAADLTDDGYVNQFDYNLFIRELTNIGGQ